MIFMINITSVTIEAHNNKLGCYNQIDFKKYINCTKIYTRSFCIYKLYIH